MYVLIIRCHWLDTMVVRSYTETHFSLSLIDHDDILEMHAGFVPVSIAFLYTFPKIVNEHAFESPNVQKFIESTGLHFDVIVLEEFFSDSFLMFSWKFKAPVVTICKFNSSVSAVFYVCRTIFMIILNLNRSLWCH